MFRCDSCGLETAFLSPQRDCFDCAQHDPLERAAKAINDLDPHPSMKWERTTDFWRNTARRDARAALDAAVNVEELSEHVGPDHAQIVRDHLLGRRRD